ncbi:MAG: transposase, partial [Halocynthiibacter sp.]
MTRKTTTRPSPKHSDAFKRQLVAESLMPGATVPEVAKRHGVPGGQIYTWRNDERFQPSVVDDTGFTPVCVSADQSALSRIEITLENGRKLSMSG